MLIAFLAEQSFYFPKKIQRCRRCTWRRSIIRHFWTNIIRRDNKGKVITLDMLIISRKKQSSFFFKRKNVQGGWRCKHRDFVPIAQQATFLCSWFKLKNISWEASHPSTKLLESKQSSKNWSFLSQIWGHDGHHIWHFRWNYDNHLVKVIWWSSCDDRINVKVFSNGNWIVELLIAFLSEQFFT